jgi:hypothetical protein
MQHRGVGVVYVHQLAVVGGVRCYLLWCHGAVALSSKFLSQHVRLHLKAGAVAVVVVDVVVVWVWSVCVCGAMWYCR